MRATVMAGLVPAIHVFVTAEKQDVDARHKAGHDDLSSDLLHPLPRRFRLHPFKLRQLVPKPGELPLGVMARIGAADLAGFVARDLALEVTYQRRHAMSLHRRQQRIELARGELP